MGDFGKVFEAMVPNIMAGLQVGQMPEMPATFKAAIDAMRKPQETMMQVISGVSPIADAARGSPSRRSSHEGGLASPMNVGGESVPRSPRCPGISNGSRLGTSDDQGRAGARDPALSAVILKPEAAADCRAHVLEADDNEYSRSSSQRRPPMDPWNFRF